MGLRFLAVPPYRAGRARPDRQPPFPALPRPSGQQPRLCEAGGSSSPASYLVVMRPPRRPRATRASLTSVDGVAQPNVAGYFSGLGRPFARRRGAGASSSRGRARADRPSYASVPRAVATELRHLPAPYAYIVRHFATRSHRLRAEMNSPGILGAKSARPGRDVSWPRLRHIGRCSARGAVTYLLWHQH